MAYMRDGRWCTAIAGGSYFLFWVEDGREKPIPEDGKCVVTCLVDDLIRYFWAEDAIAISSDCFLDRVAKAHNAAVATARSKGGIAS